MASEEQGENTVNQISNSNHENDNDDGFKSMEDHYKSSSNSYALGPGRDLDESLQPGNLAKSGAKMPTVKLYIGNIPRNLNSNGLRNYFDGFGKVIYIHFDPKRFAFISYETQAEAIKAIHKANRQPPFFLNVQFANARNSEKRDSDEERSKGSNVENEPSNYIPHNATSSRDMYRPPPIRKNTGPLRRVVTVTDYDFNQETENSLSIYGQPSKYDNSNKIIQTRIQSQQHKTSFPRDMDESQIGVPLKHNMERVTNTEGKGQFELYDCTLCGNKCVKHCHRCFAPYCNPDCQTKDWLKHRTMCFPIPKLEAGPMKAIGGGESTVHVTPQPIEINKKLFSGVVLVKHPAENKIDNISSNVGQESGTKVVKETKKTHSPFMRLKASADRLKTKMNANVEQIVQEPWQTTVNIPNNCYTQVMVMTKNSDKSFQAILSSNVGVVEDLLEEANKDPNLEPETDMTKGKLCLAVFEDLYCRAKIESVSPLKVYLLDYGIFLNIGENTLKKLPSDYFNKIPAQSVNIIESPGGSKKLKALKEANIMSTSKKNINGALEVKIEGGKYPEVTTTDTEDAMPKLIEQERKDLLPNNVKNGKNSTTIIYNKSLISKLTNKEIQLKKSLNLLYPELTIGTYITITVQFLEENFAWVSDVNCSLEATKLLTISNKEKVNRKPLSSIKVGNLGIVKFENMLYRSVIINEQPIIVRLLDFGNTLQVTADELLQISEEELLKTPPCVVKVALAPGAPFKFKLETSYDIKLIEKKNDYYIVTVRGHEPLPDVKEQIEKKKRDLIDYLKQTDSGELLINKLYCHNQATATFQIKPILESFELEHKNVQKMFLMEQQPIKAKIGDSVIVKYEETFERCEILAIENKHVYLLSLYDIGKIYESSTLYQLPEKFGGVPRLVYNLEITGLNGCPRKFQNSMINGNGLFYEVMMIEPQLEIKCSFLENPEDTFIANVTKWSPIPSTLSINFLPKPDMKKENIVVITDIINQHRIYIKEVDKNKNEKYDLLLQRVAVHAVKANPLKLLPVKDELVIAKYADGNYYRALVKKINDDNSIEVFYTEFGNCDTVLLNNLREISDDLKAEPIFIHKISLSDVPDGPVTPEASLLFENIKSQNPPIKFKLNSDESFKNVRLTYPNGKSFNKRVAELLTPHWRELENLTPDKLLVTQLGDILFLGDLKTKDVPVGQNINIVVLDTNLLCDGSFFGCYNDPIFMQKVLDVQSTLMTEYCEKINTSYLPRPEETCVAKFPHDDRWYRAVCVEPAGDTCYLFSVDVGLFSSVNIKDIRRMVPDFLVDECLAAQFFVTGLTLPLSQNKIDVINKFITSSECSIVAHSVTKNNDEDSYEIQLPDDLMKQLENAE